MYGLSNVKDIENAIVVYELWYFQCFMLRKVFRRCFILNGIVRTCKNEHYREQILR